MIAYGALHIHSNFSRDGLWSVAEVASFFRRRGYQFACLAEHSDDMDEAKTEQLRAACEALSSPDFRLIPGIEYNCCSKLHIAGFGCSSLLGHSEPVRTAHAIRDGGGFAVLAHPSRIKWRASSETLKAVNAVEAWNVRHDGEFLPCVQTLDFFLESKQTNPELLAIAGLDLHARKAFYPAKVRVTVERLDDAAILAGLVKGAYAIESPLWSLPAQGSCGMGRASVRPLRAVLDQARSARDGIAPLISKFVKAEGV